VLARHVGTAFAGATQAFVQPPQCSGSLVVSAHFPLQEIVPSGQFETQIGAPPSSCSVQSGADAGQGLHDPQCAGEWLTQAPPQSSFSGEHTSASGAASEGPSVRASTPVSGAGASGASAASGPTRPSAGAESIVAASTCSAESSTSNPPSRVVQAAIEPTAGSKTAIATRRRRMIGGL
jgi:hypothetical protein